MKIIEVKIVHWFHQECSKCQARYVPNLTRFDGHSSWISYDEDKVCNCGESDWKVVPISYVVREREEVYSTHLYQTKEE